LYIGLLTTVLMRRN